VEVVDEDLGRSGSGRVARPGFERLVSAVCLEEVGGVFALEASRLARNNRDWSHLVDLCGLTQTLIIDAEGIYDPRESNDRLLLGLKGTMSEWELSMPRQRSQAAIRQKAERGELFTTVPIGFVRTRDNRCEMDPDRRIQEMIRLVFRKFEEMGSIRQVLLWFRSEGVELPAVEYGPFGRGVIWKLPVYNTIHKVLTNPMYAGAYAFGRTKTRTEVQDGRAVRRRGGRLPQEEWKVLIPHHHEGYVSWDRFQDTQCQIKENAHMKGLMSRGAPRRGPALLAGLLRCRRCGRRLHVTYSGTDGRVPRYACCGAAVNHGTGNCLSFGGLAVDRAVEEAALAILEPGAVEAAVEAQRKVETQMAQRREILDLKLQQARYEAERARRQYDMVDPGNRLVAIELECRWEEALAMVNELEREAASLEMEAQHSRAEVDREALIRLADDLPTVWNHPKADLRLKKRIMCILIEEILAELDEDRAQIDLVP
jgi:DNA invertase Pin-like site-specific DNA recombinase